MGLVERIKILVEKHGMTLTELERELEFGKSSIRKWDINAPSVDKLYKVAKYLSVSVDFLICGQKSYDMLTSEQQELLKNWDKLTEREKGRVEQLMMMLLGSPDMQKTQSEMRSAN